MLMNQSKSNDSARPPITIFVVDDEQMLLDLAVALLQPLGYNVLTFSDPRLALKEYPAAKPAVVVTDYAMGEMNGLDLMRECRRVNPCQKIILVSGTVDENIFAGLQPKPDRFLVKPYPVQEFIETIQEMVES